MTSESALWPLLTSFDKHGSDSFCAVSAEGVRVKFEDGTVKLCGTSGLWNANLAKAGAKSVEELFGKVFEAIRKNPDHVKSTKKNVAPKYEDKGRTIVVTGKGKYRRDRRLTREQRQANVQTKKTAAKKLLSKN